VFWTVSVAEPPPYGNGHPAGNVIYYRGAMALQNLRVTVGEDTFFAIMRGWPDHRLRRADGWPVAGPGVRHVGLHRRQAGNGPLATWSPTDWKDSRMGNRVWIPVAVAGVIVVVLAGIFVFATTEGETTPGSGQTAGPAPTTQLRLSYPDPSGMEPTPDSPYQPVPDEQVDGNLITAALTEDRTLYIPVQDLECIRDEVWSRGEHADRVEVEIRPVAVPPPPGVTTGADGSYGCMSYSSSVDGPYAVIELTEPLGNRRLVVEQVYDAPPS
jgi:hypothetical protein